MKSKYIILSKDVRKNTADVAAPILRIILDWNREYIVCLLDRQNKPKQYFS